MNKAQSKPTLFEAITKRPIGYDYRHDTVWSLQSNFGINDFTELDKYCKKNGISYEENQKEYRIEFKVDKAFHFNKIKSKKFKQTAIFKKFDDGKEYYRHFGINDISCSVYGDKSEDIEDVILTFHKDQTIDKDAQEYWGWYDYKSSQFSLIYSNHSLLAICFPYGLHGAEEANQGFAVKLNVKSTKKNEKTV